METTNGTARYSLIRFGLNSRKARELAQFYERAFGAIVVSTDREDGASFANWPGRRPEGALRIVLQLGVALVDIVQFDEIGADYPGDLSPYDHRFQHLAIVVSDIALSMQRLLEVSGWTPISSDGPQTLPASGVASSRSNSKIRTGIPRNFPLPWSRSFGHQCWRR